MLQLLHLFPNRLSCLMSYYDSSCLSYCYLNYLMNYCLMMSCCSCFLNLSLSCSNMYRRLNSGCYHLMPAVPAVQQRAERRA